MKLLLALLTAIPLLTSACTHGVDAGASRANVMRTSPASSFETAPPAAEKTMRVVSTTTTVEILEQVSFTEATMNVSSRPILDAIAFTVIDNDDIGSVDVIAVAANQELADVRGQAVIDYLVSQGVAPEQLANRSQAGEEELVNFDVHRAAQ